MKQHDKNVPVSQWDAPIESLRPETENTSKGETNGNFRIEITEI